MLDVIGASTAGTASTNKGSAIDTLETENNFDFPQIFERSSLHAQVVQQIEALKMEGKESRNSRASRRSSKAASPVLATRSRFIQLLFVLSRAVISSWRNVEYNLLRMVAGLLLSIVFGLLFYRTSDPSNLAEVSSKMAAIFTTAVFSSVVGLLATIPFIDGLRPVVARERSTCMYSGWMQGLGLVIVEVPYLLVSGFLSSMIFYFIMSLDFDGTHMIIYFLAHTLIGFLLVYTSHVVSYALSSAALATLVASSIVSLIFLFGGLFIPGPGMPPGYKWLWKIDFLRHTLSTMVVPQFFCNATNDTTCPTILFASPQGLQDVFVSDFVQSFLGVSYSMRWNGLYSLLGYIGGFIVVIVLLSHFVNHIKR
eukprot:m.186100 g.186100  ORF g.186100 m.186100 type:complete len:368 (+) comp13612_c2_seq5:5238-6341(+)